MMIDDEKYLKELRDQLFSVTESHSIVDKGFYSSLSCKIRNESDEGIKELLDIIHENDKELLDGMAGSVLALHNAFMLFEANGCPQLAKRMLIVMSILSTISESADKYVEVVRRAEKSKARKGKTNISYSEAIRIAGLTWGKHPNASLAGLSDEIYAYLRQKRNGVPSVDTVYTWLKESGLNPDVKPKNRNFKLVLTEGG